MNADPNPLKFLLWGACLALLCSGTVSLTKATYHMAEAAIEAQSYEQLSYGHYSQILWSGSHHPKTKKKSR